MTLLYRHTPNPVLNEDDVYDIKVAHKELYDDFLKTVAKHHKVTPKTINNIIRGFTWKHVRITGSKKFKEGI